MPIDIGIFHWINDWPDQVSPLFIFLSEGNKLLAVRVGLLVFIFGMLVRNRQTRFAAFAVIVAVALANETTDLLKAVFRDIRPCTELLDVHLRVSKLTSFGTASAHSANMAAVATVFALALPKWAWIWVLVALLTGLSRIYVGVHYPSQVMLGWFCGILAGSFAVWGVKRVSALFKREDAQNAQSVTKGTASS